MAEYIANGWNFVHLLGGLGGVCMFYLAFRVQAFRSTLIVIAVDISKELGDTISKLSDASFMWYVGFDPAGFDIRDVVMCVIGCVTAWVWIQIHEARHE